MLHVYQYENSTLLFSSFHLANTILRYFVRGVSRFDVVPVLIPIYIWTINLMNSTSDLSRVEDTTMLIQRAEFTS